MFVAGEKDRQLDWIPDEAAVSVLTLAELRIGILIATDPGERAERLRTFARAQTFNALPVDTRVAEIFADLSADARTAGRRPNVIDTVIAATAVGFGMPVYTQDADFEEMPGVEVVRV